MKIAYSCVVDAKPKFEWQAFLWAHSLLRNAGCRPEDMKVHCMPGVSGRFRDGMRDLRVEIVDAQPFEGGHAYCNKIQQCFSSAFAGYDRALLTDTDFFFLNAPQLPGDAAFAAMPVRITMPPVEVLRKIYDEAGVAPSREIPVSCALADREVTYASNVNGGFYLIDTALLAPLGRSWKKHALWMIEHIGLLGQYGVHADQVAMALALDELKIDVRLLPAAANLPVNVSAERLQALVLREGLSRVDAVHYHDKMLPGGDIKTTGNAFADAAIAQANRAIFGIIAEHHDNELYWNNRYATFPELGSGLGSRGDILQYKKSILKNAVLLYHDRSVLEVGCGDLETSKDFGFRKYTGYDLSSAALDIARTKRPDWRFIQGTVGSSGEADLVICLDVLIHQKKAEEYRSLLEALVAAAGQRLIVSGYEQPTSVSSNITAFHEPLTASLRKFGVFHEIMEIGKYRDVSLIVADKRPTGPAVHPSDMPVEMFEVMAPGTGNPSLLRLLMDVSRECLGFFTQTSSRTIEYPWVVEKASSLPAAARILDIGSGISPLPVLFTAMGMHLSCVDAHPRIRTLADRPQWNEWGFFDYSVFSKNARSFHCDITTFRPDAKFDAIYSVSVLEHMPRSVWERTLDLLPLWLKPGGLVILTLDLIPGTYDLWNKSEGTLVDPGGNHGTLNDIVERLKAMGFILTELFARQNIPYSRTDVAFLLGRYVKAPSGATR